MDEAQDIDIEQFMERFRENIRRRRKAEERLTTVQSPAPFDDQAAADLASLRSGYDIYNIRFISHRRIRGPFVVLAKKALRKLLTPILSRQVTYNAANTRVVTQHAQVLQAMTEQIETLGQEQAHLREQALATQAQALQAMEEQVKALAQQEDHRREQALRAILERVSRAERKLRRILHVLTDGQMKEEHVSIAPKTLPRRALEPDFDYFGFQERLRGSEEEIKDRQRIYVEYFKGREPVLDIGSGRGEFLELLKEAGIDGKAVDIDLDMVLHCQEKGLDVVLNDAFAYLQAVPDDSLGGIFSAQLVEHLETSGIIQFVKLCHRKLRPGGVLVLETLNPESLFVHYKWFWMDLTHTRLIHPETLHFLFESVGLREVACRFLPAAKGPLMIPPLEVRDHSREELQRFNDATEYLNKLLYGSSDYAMIGKK